MGKQKCFHISNLKLTGSPAISETLPCHMSKNRDTTPLPIIKNCYFWGIIQPLTKPCPFVSSQFPVPQKESEEKAWLGFNQVQWTKKATWWMKEKWSWKWECYLMLSVCRTNSISPARFYFIFWMNSHRTPVFLIIVLNNLQRRIS